MKSNILEYKGYFTKIEYLAEDNVLYGKIECIMDLVNFESASVSEIENEFHSAVDDYLAFCEERGKEPNKTFKGTFNVRISPELHKKAALAAFRDDISLNQFVESAIESYVSPKNDEKSITININESVFQSAVRSTNRLWNEKSPNADITKLLNARALQ